MLWDAARVGIDQSHLCGPTKILHGAWDRRVPGGRAPNPALQPGNPCCSLQNVSSLGECWNCHCLLCPNSPFSELSWFIFKLSPVLAFGTWWEQI